MKNYALIVAALLIFTACKTDSDEVDHEEKVEIEIEKETHGNQEVAIELNNGEKWKVNAEMLPHIEKCEEAFNNFEGKDYAALSEEMMKHTNNLIQSCTIDGRSHDELHKWLHPHIELVKQLGAEDQDKAEEAFEDLSDSFDVFHSNFE